MDNYTFGGLRSLFDLRDYKMTKAGIHSQNFPKTFQLTNMPSVKDQGNINSCCAHASSTIVEYFNRTQTGETDPMSTGFIYGNRQNTIIHTQGMMLHTALENLRSDGDVKTEDFPQNIEMPQAETLFNQYYPALKDKALPYRITGYYYCPSVDSIKAALMKDGPVLVAMFWRKDMSFEEDGYTLKTKQRWFDVKEGVHTMVIYGWDETGWLIQNSWGTNWGKEGRCRIPYYIRLLETWAAVDTNIDNRTDIKKPCTSSAGKTLAKIINAIVNLFRK